MLTMVMPLLAWLLISLLLLLLGGYWYLKITMFRLKNGIPGIEPTVLLGNVADLGLNKGKTLHEGHQMMWSKFGDIYQFWLTTTRMVALCTPKAAETVFSDRKLFDSSSNVRESFKLLSPNGLITLVGEPWKRHIKHAGPMFRRHRVVPFTPLIKRVGEEFVARWRAMFPGKGAGDYRSLNTEVVEHMKNVTLDVFGHLALDYDFGCVKSMGPGGDKTANALRDATATVLVWFNRTLTMPLPTFIKRLIVSTQPAYKRSKQVIFNRIQSGIDKWKKSTPEERGMQNNLLSMMLESLDQDGGLTNEEVMDELLLFVFGGFETTSTALSWFIFFMSKHPEVQQKLKKHIKEGLAGLPSWGAEELLKIEYLDCVWKEVFRMAPIASAVNREVTEDTAVIDGCKLEKGDIVSVVSAVLHFDPRNWKIDPMRFDPERFSSDPAVGLDRNHNPYAFMPFGGGHRACLGQELAKVESKALMALFMLNVTFHDAPGNNGGYLQRITCMPKEQAVYIQFDDADQTAAPLPPQTSLDQL
jgi:cytochrome P450